MMCLQYKNIRTSCKKCQKDDSWLFGYERQHGIGWVWIFLMAILEILYWEWLIVVCRLNALYWTYIVQLRIRADYVGGEAWQRNIQCSWEGCQFGSGVTSDYSTVCTLMTQKIEVSIWLILATGEFTSINVSPTVWRTYSIFIRSFRREQAFRSLFVLFSRWITWSTRFPDRIAWRCFQRSFIRFWTFLIIFFL